MKVLVTGGAGYVGSHTALELLAAGHLAPSKSVAASFAEPRRYRENNVTGTAVLAGRMSAHRVRSLVFASSAAVYGASATALGETAPTAPTSPYGRGKLSAEQVLRRVWAAYPGVADRRRGRAGSGQPAAAAGPGGAGRGHGVVETVRAYARASGREIPSRLVGRRAGEPAMVRADRTRARALLGSEPRARLGRICTDC